MTRTLILFNLKPGVTERDYEAWAQEQEIPTLNSLKSVDRFRAYKVLGPFFTGENCPYSYAELLDVADMEAFVEGLGR